MSKKLELDGRSKFIELNTKNKINVDNCFNVKLTLEKYYDTINRDAKQTDKALKIEV